jgi:hypothetical protein
MKRIILSLIAIGAVLLPLSQKAEAHWVRGYCYHRAYWHHRYWHHGYWYAGWWHPGYWGYHGAPVVIIED